MSIECLDSRFSTTRRLIRGSAEISAYRAHLPHGATSRTGGLRTKGLVKSKTDKPLITVVTVVFNSESAIEETILSVIGQTYDNIEYIVVDGGSADRTIEVIKQYEHAIDFWISEPDRGIYDAMNKGIELSSGDWLSFMNAQDQFLTEGSVETLVEHHIRLREDTHRFFYSDVVLAHATSNGGKRFQYYKCDHNRKIINHQASVYLKALHATHGPYLVSKGVTISDYLFFSLINPAHFAKVEQPIARYDVTGVSQSRTAVEQKFIVDYLISGLSRPRFIVYFLFYFYYRGIKSSIGRFRAAYLQGVSASKDLLKRYFDVWPS
jgi:glycosyltransferase involved in cell wall biosynthesis